MKLHELKPAPGSRHSRKRLGRGMSADMVRHPVVVTKVNGHVPAEVCVPALKAVKTRCTDVFQNGVLRIFIVKNSRL